MINTNPLRTALENGDTVVGPIARTSSPAVIEVYGELDFDFVFVDFEHGNRSPLDSHHVEHLVRAGVIGEIEPLVRVPAARPPMIRKVLDTGTTTVLIPRVKTAEEVRKAVEASRYEYRGEPGERGFPGESQANLWGRNTEGYRQREDSNNLVGINIETAEAIQNLDEILSVPDLGFVLIGPGDLATSLGVASEGSDSELRKAMDRVQDACLSADVPVGTVATTPEEANEAIDQEYQLVLMGSEIRLIRSVYSTWLEEIDR